MNTTLWDFQISQTGGSLSNHQMEVLGNLHNGRTHVPASRPMPQWHGDVLRSALAMLSPVVSLYLTR